MRVLIIDNNIDPAWWGARNLRKYASLLPGATFHTRRGPHDDLPRDVLAYDRVVISGSGTSCLAHAPWIDHLDQAILRWIDAGTPLLGVCYGHQSIVRAIGGRENLRRAENAEFGWTRIDRTASSPLLEGLPSTFYSYSAHFEEVAQLPSECKPFARSEWCGIQGFQIEGKPVFGIQFHPEKDATDAERTFRECLAEGKPKTLLHPKESAKYYDAKIGEAVFGNFFKFRA